MWLRFDATTLWHFDAAEWAPSTTSKREILRLSLCFPLFPYKRTQVGHAATSGKCHERPFCTAKWKTISRRSLRNSRCKFDPVGIAADARSGTRSTSLDNEPLVTSSILTDVTSRDILLIAKGFRTAWDAPSIYETTKATIGAWTWSALTIHCDTFLNDVFCNLFIRKFLCVRKG
jgi:hypothetical protein